MSQSQPMRLLTSRATTEWYTPPHIINLARTVLGEIDLDPASAPKPQKWIRANNYYSKTDNGLAWPWQGRVWLNPPFDNSAAWARTLIAEYQAGNVTAALLLLNSNLGYKWFEEIWTTWPCCCLQKRLRFVREDGTVGGESKRGQTIIYMGEATSLFTRTFEQHGRILIPQQIVTK